MIERVEFCNVLNKDVIYFFVDDSGSILSENQQKDIAKKMNNKEVKIENNLKAFSVSAISLTRGQIKKGYKLATRMKNEFNLDKKIAFHRNKMKFGKPQGGFKNLDDKALWHINQSLNNFIKKEKLSIISVGRNNYAEIYCNNIVKKGDINKNIYFSLLKMINKIMIEKYSNKKAIIIFESENGNDYNRLKLSIDCKKLYNLEKIRSIRFMKKNNNKGYPNFGIELVDYINGSSFSYFSLLDLHIHMNNNVSFKEYLELDGLKYIKS